MRTSRAAVALAATAALIAGSGQAVAQEKNASEQIGVKINNCYFTIDEKGVKTPVYELDEKGEPKINDKGEKIQKCEVKDVAKPSEGSSKVIDGTWNALTSSQNGSSDNNAQGSSTKEGEKDGSAESKLPTWAIVLLAVLGTVAALAVGVFALTVENFSIRLI